MFKTYSSSSSLVITSRWFATSRLVAPVSVRLVYSMGRPSDHPWWKPESPESFLVARIISLFLVINTKCASFLFNHIPTYQMLGRLRGSCLIARPSNGSHLATGRPLLRNTADGGP